VIALRQIPTQTTTVSNIMRNRVHVYCTTDAKKNAPCKKFKGVGAKPSTVIAKVIAAVALHLVSCCFAYDLSKMSALQAKHVP